MSGLWQDLRYTARSLGKAPSFALGVIVTLALGIGVNSAMFSFADATAFRPPDVPRPGELVRIFSTTKAESYGQQSYPDYLDFRDRAQTLSDFVAYSHALFAMSTSAEDVPAVVGGAAVSGNFFSALEIQPALGRSFREDEDRPGADRVVVISHKLWEAQFKADPSVVGSRIRLGAREFTIVGVAPRTFMGTELYFHPQIYVPLASIREAVTTLPARLLHDRSNRWLNVLARMKPGIDARQADVEVAALARSLEQSYPETNSSRTTTVLPEVEARGKLDDGGHRGAALSLVIVGLILLIACANVANLTLSRAVGRKREVALRLALGATRHRLVGQLLIESIMLACLGGLIGLLVAHAGIRFLSVTLASNFAVTDMPIAMDARIDARVLLFTLAASLTTGILFGLSPALQGTRPDLVPALKSSLAGDGRPRGFRLRNVVVGFEIALAVLILTSVGLSVKGFIDKQRADPGYRTDNVLLVSFNPSLVNYSREQTIHFYEQIVERTRTLPGVVAVGLAQIIPLGVNSSTATIVIDGYGLPEGQDRISVAANVVDAGYWRAMRTRIVRGRPFREVDTSDSPGVAIVNETMAKRYWPIDDPIGKIVYLGDRTGRPLEVVGIAQDGKYTYLGEPQQPYLFMAQPQRFRPMMTMVVLARNNPAALAAPIRAEVRRIGSGMPLFDVRTLDQLYQSRALMSSRLSAQIFVLLGTLALGLAAVGLYSVIAYLTTLRTKEIGIRMAVGADRWQILVSTMTQAVPMVVPGLIAGVVLSYYLTPALAVPFDFVPRDAAIMTVVPIFFALVAFAACWIPARRAARVDPLVALRCE